MIDARAVLLEVQDWEIVERALTEHLDKLVSNVDYINETNHKLAIWAQHEAERTEFIIKNVRQL